MYLLNFVLCPDRPYLFRLMFATSDSGALSLTCVFFRICFVPLTGNINYSKILFVTRKNSPKGPAALSRYNIKATDFAGGYLLQHNTYHKTERTVSSKTNFFKQN